VSPTLQVGKSYTYSFQAEFTQDGKPVVVSKDIDITAGAEVNVSLFSASEVAAR